jgi:hypothetical protein
MTLRFPRLATLALAALVSCAGAAALSGPAHAESFSLTLGIGDRDDHFDNDFDDEDVPRRHVRPRYASPDLDSQRFVYERPQRRTRQVCRLVPTRVYDDYEGDYVIVDVKKCNRQTGW